MVRLYRAILGHYSRAFNNWQDITLYAVTGHVMIAAMTTAGGHLVNLVKEYDTAGFCHLYGFFGNLFHIHQLHGFFLLEQLAGCLHSNLPLFVLLWHHAANNILNIVTHPLQRRTGKHTYHWLIVILNINFNHLVFVLTGQELFTAPFTSCLVLLWFLIRIPLGFLIIGAAKELTKWIHHRFLWLWHHNIKNSLLCHFRSLLLYLLQTGRTYHTHGGLSQIADNGFHVTAYITNLSKLGGLHLNEWSLYHFGQTAGDFSFSHTCGANHKDVLWNNIILHAFAVKLAAAPTISKGNSHRTLGCLLSYYIFI